MVSNDRLGLCGVCKRMVFTMMAKNCPRCRKENTNSCWKRCPTCATKLNKCAYCDKPITQKKGKKYATGARPFRQYGLGALPPPGHEWETGLTAASIAFVNQATDAITQGRVTDRVEINFLNDAIDQLKSKQVVLTEWLEVDEFLKTGELPK